MSEITQEQLIEHIKELLDDPKSQKLLNAFESGSTPAFNVLLDKFGDRLIDKLTSEQEETAAPKRRSFGRNYGVAEEEENPVKEALAAFLSAVVEDTGFGLINPFKKDENGNNVFGTKLKGAFETVKNVFKDRKMGVMKALKKHAKLGKLNKRQAAIRKEVMEDFDVKPESSNLENYSNLAKDYKERYADLKADSARLKKTLELEGREPTPEEVKQEQTRQTDMTAIYQEYKGLHKKIKKAKADEDKNQAPEADRISQKRKALRADSEPKFSRRKRSEEENLSDYADTLKEQLEELENKKPSEGPQLKSDKRKEAERQLNIKAIKAELKDVREKIGDTDDDKDDYELRKERRKARRKYEWEEEQESPAEDKPEDKPQESDKPSEGDGDQSENKPKEDNPEEKKDDEEDKATKRALKDPNAVRVVSKVSMAIGEDRHGTNPARLERGMTAIAVPSKKKNGAVKYKITIPAIKRSLTLPQDEFRIYFKQADA